jgi:hypothetical protein
LTALPLVLFGLRCIPDDEGISPFIAVTGKTPLFPADFLTPSKDSSIDFSDFINRFSKVMRQLDFRAAPDLHSTGRKTFIPPELSSCTHVYVRVDRIRKTLEAPYTGPFLVLERCDRNFKLQMTNTRTDLVSIERLKPAFNKPVTLQPTVIPDLPNVSSNLIPDHFKVSSNPESENIVRRNPIRSVRFNNHTLVKYF